MAALVVVAPLKEGMAARARELLEQGPPFELEKTMFDRHAVHLTDREVIFVFESSGPAATLELHADAPELKLAAEAWQECFAERPRVARRLFSWERAETPEDVSFEPTPGPGDSDGGDVFRP